MKLVVFDIVHKYFLSEKTPNKVKLVLIFLYFEIGIVGTHFIELKIIEMN